MHKGANLIPSNETWYDNATSSNGTSTSEFGTAGQGAIPSNETWFDNATSSNETSTSEYGTAETQSQAPEEADFVVYDNNKRPCLLASLNITLHFKYQVQVGLVRETYETISKKNTQDGSSSYWGSCEESQSSLSITWNNDTFTLNLTFTLQDKNSDNTREIDMNVFPPGANSSAPSWLLQQVSLSYNTANQKIFPGASPALEKVRADNLGLFKTPLGMAYMCKTPEVVTVEFNNVDLAFNFVHLMPFGAQSTYFSNDTVLCSGDVNSVPLQEESYTVPLVVAAVLAAIVISILVVYATVRCVARRVRQSQYKQME
ncbi:hypothetical protein ACOMHN_058689 [Nucella lapillus]